MQTNHATWSMATRYGTDDVPNVIVIGVPDATALHEACALLSACVIAHWTWTEPDEKMGLGFTAITTEPIVGDRRKPLSHYRLWKPNAPVAQLTEPIPLKDLVVGENPTGRTM